MTHISKALRRQVIERAGGHCEYCKAPQAIILQVEIDHIIPEAAGGLTEADNLCMACGHCNGHKSVAQAGIDPVSGQRTPFFNPRTQRWSDHFTWSGDFTLIVGLTPTGRATVAGLQMNLDDVMQARAHWLCAGWTPAAVK